MTTMTTIQLKQEVVALLKQAKEYPRQTYNELLQKMTKVFQSTKQKNQYDEFLHKIQQPKMKELWDNPADEEWERV